MEKDSNWGKYTPWNKRWLFSNKYDEVNKEKAMLQGFPADGSGGMYGGPVSLREDFEEFKYYPAEKFFWEHISELKERK